MQPVAAGRICEVVPGEVMCIYTIYTIVKFSNVVMNHIFNDIQPDEYEKRKHEHVDGPMFKVFLKYLAEHCLK